MGKRVLVIGANGAIGREAVQQLLTMDDISAVFAVARDPKNQPTDDKLEVSALDTNDESAIADYCQRFGPKDQHLHGVVCATGMLHEGDSVSPEKRLEDISSAQLARYFEVNSILPMLWLKHLVSAMHTQQPSVIALLSARVGSISDNHLGGWYGYRAAKAALNMLVKTAQVEYRRRNKQVSLLCYHPGTVDSELSKPFQRNVPEGKLFTPEFTMQQLLQLMPECNSENAPYYLDWQGKNIPW